MSNYYLDEMIQKGNMDGNSYILYSQLFIRIFVIYVRRVAQIFT